MGDWRVHTGTDYAAESGARVYAVSDGTVTQAEMDAQYGGVVVLELTDGKQAVYQCLDEEMKVSAGDAVRAGDVIGTVGTQGYAEATRIAICIWNCTRTGPPLTRRASWAARSRRHPGKRWMSACRRMAFMWRNNLGIHTKKPGRAWLFVYEVEILGQAKMACTRNI